MINLPRSSCPISVRRSVGYGRLPPPVRLWTGMRTGLQARPWLGEGCDWPAGDGRVIRIAPGAAWLPPVRSGCTAAAACGYGTGVGGSAAATAAGGVHGFPAALTSFIGRAGPVREVAGLLEEYRLVTVTGPGGVGKTRLAGQVARAGGGPVRGRGVAGGAGAGAGPGAGRRRWWRRRWGCGSSRGCRRPRRWRGCWPGSSCCWCWITAST